MSLSRRFHRPIYFRSNFPEMIGHGLWECHGQSKQTSLRHWAGTAFLSQKKRYALKIVQYVKTPQHNFSMRVECSIHAAPGFAQTALNFSFLRELIVLGPSLTVLPVMRTRNFAYVVGVVCLFRRQPGVITWASFSTFIQKSPFRL